MIRYLVVDDRDGRVIADAASLVQAANLRRHLMLTSQGNPPISLIRLNHEEDGLSAVSSMVAMRPLIPS